VFRFSRPAPWLRQLFTPSHTTQPNPGELSGDVSLVQPYDGSGWPLFDPGEWDIATQSSVAIASTTALVTAGALEVVRILAASVRLDAGVAPVCHLQGENSVVFGEDVTAVGGSEQIHVPSNCPILGPTHVLYGRHHTGDAATQVTWVVYYVRAPIGTVFYL